MMIEDIAKYMEEELGHEYFDAYEAVHVYLTLNHSGQFSTYYRMLSESEFRPGPMWSESRVIAENMSYDDVEAAIAHVDSLECEDATD